MSSTKSMQTTRTFSEFAKQADYSFMDSLKPDPQATDDGDDHLTREVFLDNHILRRSIFMAMKKNRI